MGFNVVYTDTFPADLASDKDIQAHHEIMSSGKLGLVKKDGLVCRTVRSFINIRCSAVSSYAFMS